MRKIEISNIDSWIERSIYFPYKTIKFFNAESEKLNLNEIKFYSY